MGLGPPPNGKVAAHWMLLKSPPPGVLPPWCADLLWATSWPKKIRLREKTVSHLVLLEFFGHVQIYFTFLLL